MSYVINGYEFHPEVEPSFQVANKYTHIAIECIMDLKRLIEDTTDSENIKRIVISDELKLQYNMKQYLNGMLQRHLWERYMYKYDRPLRVSIGIEDGNLVCRCEYDNGDFMSNGHPDYFRFIDPMIIPITIEYRDVERLDVCSSEEEHWDTYLDPGEVEFLENIPAIRFKHEGKTCTVAYKVVEQYTETVIEIKPDKSRENERILPWTDRDS